MSPNRLAIRLPNWVGDILLARPALHALRARWRHAALHGMAREGHLGLVERLGLFERIDPAPAAGALAGALSIRRAARAVRAFGPDTVVLMAPSFEAALVARLAGVERRIGHETDNRGSLLTDAVAPRPEVHRSEAYLDLISRLDAEGETGGAGVQGDPLPPLVLKESDRAYAARLFRAMGWPDGCRPVFVNPAAAKTPRAWSSDRYRALVERLAARRAAGGPPLVVHARPPFEAPEGWAAAHGVALAGDATLPELVALLERCVLYVGNDSGPAHLAAAAGIPTVSVYGSSWPFRTAPRTAAGVPHVAVSAAFACSPCRERFFEECPSPPSADGRPPCLDVIATDSVVRAVERLLSRASP